MLLLTIHIDYLRCLNVRLAYFPISHARINYAKTGTFNVHEQMNRQP